MRKIKKIFINLFSFKNPLNKQIIIQAGPLIILIIIGLSIAYANIQAQDVKSENFGHNNILFKISKGTDSDNYWEDDVLLEEIEEGPLVNATSPSSYLENEVLSQDTTDTTKIEEGINTLISTTQNESALIAPEITDTNILVKKRDKIIDYNVRPGDTISTIAAKFNITTVTILLENNLSYYSTIKPGQTLKILPLTGLTHKVKKGDTIRSIAKEYKANDNEILEFNKLDSAEDLQISQIVVIPGGVKKTVATPSTVSVKNIFTPPTTISGTKLQWPTNSYRITQYYNWRHSGLDIGNKTGQPLYAAETGKVEQAGWNRGGYGYYVMINHGGGLKTLYAHMSKINVTVGQNVARGYAIGAVGNTGRSTGPHLHFEVRVNNIKVNPLGYIR